MGKSKNRASAVRKIDPVTDEVMEPDTASESDTVLESGTAVVKSDQKNGINPIAAAGHTIEGLSETYKTKSGVIRFLAAQGFQTKHIAVWMGIRYQHVRNVLTVQLKKPAGPTMAEPVGNKSESVEETEEAE